MITKKDRAAELAAIEEFIHSRGVSKQPSTDEIARREDIPWWPRYDKRTRKFTRAPLPKGERNWAWG